MEYIICRVCDYEEQAHDTKLELRVGTVMLESIRLVQDLALWHGVVRSGQGSGPPPHRVHCTESIVKSCDSCQTKTHVWTLILFSLRRRD